MTRSSICLVVLAAALVPAGALAAEREPQVAVTGERRLAPEEVEKILEDAAARNREGPAASISPSVEQPGAQGLPVHGEVGFAIGTDGYRAAHGTAIVGLPGSGQAIVSFGTSRLPDQPFYYRYR